MPLNKLRFLRLANSAGKNPYVAYGLAIVAVVIATIVRIGLDGFILPGTPFITYFPALVVTTFFCGLRPGIAALFLSAVTAWYFFVPPLYAFTPLNTDAVIALLTFLLVGGFDVSIIGLLNATVAKIVEQEKTAMLLVHEVQHRTNNLLTIIQSIAERSLSADHSLAQGKEMFEARLQALARTHRRLANSNIHATNIDEIVRTELEAFSSRISIQGPSVLLRHERAQRFALTLHELATNAVKHGALSVPTGKIQIAWTVTKAGKKPILKFHWKETGGPPVVTPTRRGFGTVLLKTTFSGVRLDYAPEGLTCEFETDLTAEETELVA